jgi:hypothetical protein
MPSSYRGTQRMALKKRSTVRRKRMSSASKKPRTTVRARIRRPRQKESVAARTTTPRLPTYARVSQHARVTAGRSHKRPTLGFFDPAKAIHAGNTAHFDVSYLSRLGQKGAESGTMLPCRPFSGGSPLAGCRSWCKSHQITAEPHIRVAWAPMSWSAEIQGSASILFVHY